MTRDNAPWFRRFVWLVPGIVAALVYAQSLANGFALDDEWIVEKNELIRSPSKIGTILTSDYWAAKGSTGHLYRPLTVLSYAANFAVGGLDPVGYHLINVLLHAAVSILTYLVLQALGLPSLVSLVSAILFAVHPIHVEAVSNVVGRAELLAAAGVLAAFRFDLEMVRASGRRRSRLQVCALTSFALALLSKENSIAYSVVPALADACFLRDGAPSAWAAIMRAWRRHAAILAVAAAYLALRAAVLGDLTIAEVAPEDNTIAGVATGVRILSALAIVARYAWLVAWPATLSYDYGPGAFDPVTSAADPSALAGLAIMVSLAVLLLRARKRAPAVAVLACFLVATYSIISNFVVPIGTAMGERLLYLPSFAILALLTIGFDWIARIAMPRRERAGRAVLATIVMLPIVLLAGRSFRRSQDWKSDRILFLRQIEAPVKSSKILFNAGLMRLDDKDYPAATGLFDQAIALHRTPKSLFFSGRARGVQGDDQSRKRIYRELIAEFPGSFHAEFAAGFLCAQEDRNQEACTHFEKALAREAFDGGARNNLGIVLMKTGDFRGAVEVLSKHRGIGELAAERENLLLLAQERIRSGPGPEPRDGVPALVREGIAHYNGGAYEDAARMLESARARAKRLDESSYVALGGSLRKLAKPVQAAEVLTEGVGVFPGSTRLIEQLAMIQYSELKQFREAAESFRRLLKLAPEHPNRAEFKRALDWLQSQGY